MNEYEFSTTLMHGRSQGVKEVQVPVPPELEYQANLLSLWAKVRAVTHIMHQNMYQNIPFPDDRTPKIFREGVRRGLTPYPGPIRCNTPNLKLHRS